VIIDVASWAREAL